MYMEKMLPFEETRCNAPEAVLSDVQGNDRASVRRAFTAKPVNTHDRPDRLMPI